MAVDRLFISYRREASAGHAGRLLDTLAQRLGEEHIFMDTAIAPGENFVERLRAELATCQAMVVVIAPGWAEIGQGDASGARLKRHDDWVRLEIETALQMGMRIVPALVARAEMPQPGDLPALLRPLLERQAVELRDASWEDDVRRLLSALDITPANRAGRYAGTIALVAALAVAAGVVAVISEMPGLPGAADRDDMRRLTSYQPTQAQQDALVERYLGYQLNVPLLRRFLERARLDDMPVKDLQAGLETFVSRYRYLLDTYTFHDLGTVQYNAEPKPACSDTVKLAATAQFDAMKKQFLDAARQMLAVKRPNNDQRAYAAWCLWLKGQTEMLDLDYAAAQASFGDAMKLASNMTGKEVLRHKLLQSAATLARAQGQVPEALQHLIDAAPLAKAWSKPRQAELMIEIAKLYEEQGQDAPALDWRARAQALYDGELNPGDAAARTNAGILSKAYDKAGRNADAQALRDRYGLSK